jgi:ATP-dependent helicase/nuclease subunit A
MFVPPWAEPTSPRPLAPSLVEADDSGAGKGSRTPGADRSRLRGRIIHRLLQSLPSAAPARRAAFGHRWIARHASGLPAEERGAMLKEVLTVIDDPRYGALFAEDSLPEVEVTGMVGERLIVGRVDRLVVTDTDVSIVDYKTDASPPRIANDVPERYVRQMAAYRLVLQAIYPNHRIHCLLLWTQTPWLMRLEDEALDRSMP